MLGPLNAGEIWKVFVDSEILLEIDFLVITPSNDSNLDFPGHILKISQNQSQVHKFENF